MITIVYSTHRDSLYNAKFKQHLIQSVGLKDVQILEYQNNNEFSLSQIYNRGISESLHNIVVCLHNDVRLETGWGKKLLSDFQKNSEYAILGKAGTCYFPESGVYWEKMHTTMVGQVYHHPEGQNKWLSKYSAKLPEVIPVVSLDGLFIAFDKTKIKHHFDETIGKFHFYDHPFCLSNFLDGVKIGVVTSFDITHQSVGKPNEEFWLSKEVFLEKFKDKLPIDLKPTKIFTPEVIERPIKNVGKVAVIIPTKNKLDLLFNCLDSYIENCNTNMFDIFIADTGSEDSEKELIKNYMLEKSSVVKINLIEYDYYNFSKINNDVVKNYIGPEYEFILFSNNDIKLLNNVIYEMLKIFKTKTNVGTVGARLHFADNTIQHDGMVMFVKNSRLEVSHFGLSSYYNFKTDVHEIIGNTGALVMIRKEIFKKIGMFNENYISCFEDVELNLRCILSNLKNYFCGKCVAYHYESQTRNDDDEKIQKLQQDYNEHLLPFVRENFQKLQSHILRTDNKFLF